MNIIRKQPNESGAYPPIQSWDRVYAPEKFYEVADGVELSCGGFGTLTIVDNIVTGFTGDETAWNAWQAEHQPPTPPPTSEERISALETLVLELGGVI